MPHLRHIDDVHDRLKDKIPRYRGIAKGHRGPAVLRGGTVIQDERAGGDLERPDPNLGQGCSTPELPRTLNA